jgi:hypothetical protein
MYRYLFIVLVIVCFACKERKQPETIVADNPEPVEDRRKEVEFERITFSVVCYLCHDWGYRVKDVEIHEDSTVYFRKRHNWSVKDSFVGKLDSADMAKVYKLLSAIDFNTLKVDELEEEDSPYFSVNFKMYNGEVNMRGSLNVNVWKRLLNLLTIVEEQKLKITENRRFSSAKDVPSTPPEEFKPKDYSRLLDSL